MDAAESSARACPFVLSRKGEHVRRSICSPELAIQVADGSVTNEGDGQVRLRPPHRAKRRVRQARDSARVDSRKPLPIYYFNRHEPL